MPVGTSTGELYEDSFDFQTKSPLATNYLSQGEGVVPKEGQTPPVPNLDLRQQNRLMAEPFIPDSLKPDDRPLQNLPDEPGKIPEVQTDPGMALAQGAADAISFLPVGGASSKAMFLGLGGMRRLLGDLSFENTVKRADSILARSEPVLNRRDSVELSMKTGITLGADNLPRYEIPNHRSVILEENMLKGPPSNTQINSFSKNYTLSPKMGNTVEDILHHPELFKAYPDLAKIKVYPLSDEYKNRPGVQGVFGNDGIQLAPMEPDKLRDVLLHELQHGIQRKEGFARGGDRMDYAPDLATRAALTDEAYNKWMAHANETYLNLAGEVEARNVVTRRDLPLLKRARILPEDTEDVSRSKQIIKK